MAARGYSQGERRLDRRHRGDAAGRNGRPGAAALGAPRRRDRPPRGRRVPRPRTVKLPGPDYDAPAKLNLFLHVLGRRDDGYHQLQTVFTLIDYADRLRFRVRDDGAVDRVRAVEGVPAERELEVGA